MAKGTLYLTTPPRAPSGELDVDFALEVLGADVLARSSGLQGVDVRFALTSLDCGRVVARAADERGGTPQDLANQWADAWQGGLKALDVAPDAVTRTSETRHQRVVKALFLKLFDQEDIYQGTREGPYCGRCEAFVEGEPPADGCCARCGEALGEAAEEAYFFRASRHQKAVLAHLDTHGSFLWPSSLQEAMRAAAQEGVPDVCISRPRRGWAVPVPIDPDHVIEDWFVGLIGYLTGSGYLADPQVFERYWPPSLQVVPAEAGQLHAVTWPALLVAAGLALPDRLVVRGRVRLEDNGPSLGGLLERLGSEALRFGLLRSVSYVSEGVVSPLRVVQRCNAGLSDRLARLVETVLAVIAEQRGGRVPRPGALGDAETVLVEACTGLFERTGRLVGELDFCAALDELWKIIDAALDYAAARGVGKPGASGRRLDTALYVLAEACRLLAVSLRPFLPATAAAIEERFGVACEAAPPSGQAQWGLTQPDTPVRRGEPLLPRIAHSAL